MPTPEEFFQMKSKLRDRAERRGLKMSHRQAHRLTAAWFASGVDAAEAYHRMYADETGETAVDRVITAWLVGQARAAGAGS